ncbi:MAG: DUF423 domain-containing protein [Alphaproteobacteria bacterium]|nr:DUF423 domain-containing protein [Alphaproteobacteria bacterium]
MRLWIFLAAVNGVLALAAGAYAAHGVSEPQNVMLLEQASRYQMIHALALFGVAWLADRWPGSPPVRLAGMLFLAGIVLFCGTLSLHATTGLYLRALPPVGGIAFMGGWVALAWAALRERS